MTKAEYLTPAFRHSDFGFLSSFVLSYRSFPYAFRVGSLFWLVQIRTMRSIGGRLMLLLVLSLGLSLLVSGVLFDTSPASSADASRLRYEPQRVA
jgi:hypothetical protein